MSSSHHSEVRQRGRERYLTSPSPYLLLNLSLYPTLPQCLFLTLSYLSSSYSQRLLELLAILSDILVSSCARGSLATELWSCRHRGTTLTIRRSPGPDLYPAKSPRWMMITRASGVLCRALTTLSQVELTRSFVTKLIHHLFG